MASTIPLISTVSQFDRTIWQVENSIRQTGEWVEWQWQRLGNWVWGNESTGLSAPTWWGDLLLWIARGLAVLIILWLIRALFQQLRGWRRWFTRKVALSDALQQSLVSDQTTVQDWLQQAMQAQTKGDYAAGCRALYMALLLRLEETGWINGDRTFTNQEYLRRLESQWVLKAKPTRLQAAWRQIFQVHETAYYGAASVSPETFHACQQAYQTLEGALEQPPEVKP
ncbi:DUF4129 domain-containing protein [Acaryochloris sp. IP29b_bin.148]|uniref:DUF4129 domain-containing protein n=1 Tax=Acaryochloris sp. IP29b_bin.148 TaxID=2969218 RepID=UPI002603182B|nr:DUF4129 domain-containing protein [Acaryochloris sp. IP29b_bin.148]